MTVLPSMAKYMWWREVGVVCILFCVDGPIAFANLPRNCLVRFPV
jgi:hypothetical protein